MSGRTVDLLELLCSCLTAAYRGSAEIQAICKTGNLQLVDKARGKGDPATGAKIVDAQTQADRNAEQAMLSLLRSAHPGMHIVSEEEQEDGRAAQSSVSPMSAAESRAAAEVRRVLAKASRSMDLQDVIVYVDPLDGTAEFAGSFSEPPTGTRSCVTTLVGICCAGTPVGGVIHYPFQEDGSADSRTLVGVSDVGAMWIDAAGRGTPLDVRRPGCIAELSSMSTTRFKSHPIVQDCRQLLGAQNVERRSAMGHNLAGVASGRVGMTLLPRPGCKSWDTAAGEAVLAGVGGTVTDVFGNPLQYRATGNHANSRGVMASLLPLAAHRVLIGRIAPAVRRHSATFKWEARL